MDVPQKYPTHLIEVKWKTRVANKVKEPWQGKPRDLSSVGATWKKPLVPHWQYQKKKGLHQGQVKGKEVHTRLATYNLWSSFLVGVIDVNCLIRFVRKSNNVMRMGQACGGLESSPN